MPSSYVEELEIHGVGYCQIQEKVMHKIRYMHQWYAFAGILHVISNLIEIVLEVEHIRADMDDTHAEQWDMPDKRSVSRKNLASSRASWTSTIFTDLRPNARNELWK